MASHLRMSMVAALLVATSKVSSAQSGQGVTTRYWDCCKTSCGSETSGVTGPVITCDVNDNPFTDPAASAIVSSGCAGGDGFACSDQTPWAINDNLSYGFAAVNNGQPSCCACYKLTFTSGPVVGKQMIVQATNTGVDLSNTQFDLAIPGGGYGIYDGCTTEWNATPEVWGEARYGGASTDTCDQFPAQLQAGCRWRWDWFMGADNPTVDYEPVDCPAELIARSGCSRL